MTLFYGFLLVVSTLIFTSACTQKAKTEGPATEMGHSMQELKQSLIELFPLAASKEKYADPDNRKTILKQIDQLKTQAHQIQNEKSQVSADPQYAYLSKNLENDLKLAQDSLQLGQVEFSRYVLKNSISNCVQCHTSLPYGPQFPKEHVNHILSRLDTFEKAEFQTSLREYDAALENYLRTITESGPNLSERLRAEQAAEGALAITVRMRASPDDSLKVTKIILGKKDQDPTLVKNANLWQTQIQKWRSSEKKDKKRSTAMNGKTLIAKAESISTADKIGALRRQYYLTRAFESRLTPEDRSQASYLMGLTLDSENNLLAGGLSNYYYEACIRNTPHTDEAERCYKKYEDNVSFGFTGSSGVNIPDELKQKLGELKNLASSSATP